MGKIVYSYCGNSFLKNIFVVPIQKLGKILRTKESDERCMNMYNKQQEKGV